MSERSDRIYHLALEADWNGAPSDPYTTSTVGKTLADEGFIHCSFADQVAQTAERYYADRDDVLLLEIDVDRLTAPVKLESADDGQQFPHLYGALNRDAVVRVSRRTPEA